jgi:tripartite-type tricarboxylate transporter receptor subunit TctC
MKRKHLLIVAVLTIMLSMMLGACGSGSSGGREQAAIASIDSYPSKPIQIVVAVNAGGDNDLYYRMIAKYLEKEFGQPVVVTNMPGGSATVAMQHVLNSQSDGYTLLAIDWGGFVTPFVVGLADSFGSEPFKTVGLILSTKDWGLIARGDAPYNNLREMAEYGKNHEIIYGGLARSYPNMIGLDIMEKLNINLHIVDIGAAAPRIQALLAKEVDLIYMAYTNIPDYLATKQFKFITVLSDERFFRIPDVPIPADEGFPDMINGDKYFPLFFDSKVDPGIIKKFTEAIVKVMKNPEFVEEMKNRNGMVNPNFDRSSEILQVQTDVIERNVRENSDRM